MTSDDDDDDDAQNAMAAFRTPLQHPVAKREIERERKIWKK